MAGSIHTGGYNPHIQPNDVRSNAPSDIHNEKRDDHHVSGGFPQDQLGQGPGGFDAVKLAGMAMRWLADRAGFGAEKNAADSQPAGNGASPPSKSEAMSDIKSSLLNAGKMLKPIVEGVIDAKKSGMPLSLANVGSTLLQTVDFGKLLEFVNTFTKGVKDYTAAKKADGMDPAKQHDEKDMSGKDSTKQHDKEDIKKPAPLDMLNVLNTALQAFLPKLMKGTPQALLLMRARS